MVFVGGMFAVRSAARSESGPYLPQRRLNQE
jgi:hypothetical protein